MGLLHAKHQKLILQCYPPGKAVDKKPNPLELSYLLYYASTRRVKLEKVITFLQNKTKSDVRARKSGNLQVTLSLISALIDKCSDNLNSFAKHVCSIFLSILPLKELPLFRSLVSTYGVLCSKLDNGLFSGDKNFVDLFSQLTLEMFSLSESQALLDKTNSKEWKYLALVTSRYVFNCVSFNQNLRTKLISICVPILAEAISKSLTASTLSARLKADLNMELAPGTLVKVATKSVANARNLYDATDESSLSDDYLGEEALSGLRVLFDTSHAIQLALATEAVVEYELSTDNSWGTALLEICASFIPVQQRFIAFLALLTKLTSLSDAYSKSPSKYKHMKHYAQNLSGLVSSGFNMIGLSISDVTFQLLTLQTALYLKFPDSISEEEILELSGIYTECICNLSSHIYYYDQVSDAVNSILLQIDTVLVSHSTGNTERSYLLVLTLIKTIMTILDLLATKSSAIARNYGTLEILESSLPLLTFSKSYPKFANDATQAQVVSIQALFLEMFTAYLDKEIAPRHEVPSSEDVTTRQDKVVSRFVEPNFNGYLDEKENILNDILHHSHDYFEDVAYTVENAYTLLQILGRTLELTGINFVKNFILQFDLWKIQNVCQSDPEKARDTVSYVLLSKSIPVLDSLYDEGLSSNSAITELTAAIGSDIKYRQSQGVWKSDFDNANSDMDIDGPVLAPTAVAESSFESTVNQTLLSETFSKTSFKAWIPEDHLLHLDTVSDSLFIANGFGNGSMNGDILPLSNGYHHGESPGDSCDVVEYGHLEVPRTSGSGLGLGSANDISSIYSGLANGHFKGVGNGTADTSLLSHNTLMTLEPPSALPETPNYLYAPRVEDLRQSVNGNAVDDQFSFHVQNGSSHRNILQRQIITTDVGLILDGLKSEDDQQIVV